jgi:hypothetical protein
LELHPLRKNSNGKGFTSWKMTKDWLSKYDADNNIIKFEFTTETKTWWPKALPTESL